MSTQPELLREAVELLRAGHQNKTITAFLAKIDAAKGDVPEGFVMVPVVMTDEMFNAMSYAIADDEPTLSIYNKLLAASGRQDGAR